MGSTTAPHRTVLQPDWRPGQPVDRTGCPADRHGTAAFAKAGCQCADAYLDLRRMWKRARTGRRVPAAPAVGVARRLQGLACAGWSGTDLATYLGCSKPRVHELREGISMTVTPATWKRVRDLTERLRHRQPPATTKHQLGIVTRTRRHAATRGWAPLDAWEPDEIDDPEALSDLDYQRAGTEAQRAGAEYLEKVEVLGLTVEDIALDHGVSVEAVETGLRRERQRLHQIASRKVSDEQLEHALDRVLAGVIKQKDAAAALGISRSHLSNIIAGRGRAAARGLAVSRLQRATSEPPTAPPQEGRVA